MLLKCNECGHENQLGAIFCRDCGVKLDVENMRPKIEDSKPKIPIMNIARNIFAIVVIVGLALILGLMFFPAKGSSVALDEAERTKTDVKFQALINKIGGEIGENKYVFTPDEVTYLYNNKLIETDGEGKRYAIEKMHFSIDSANNIILLAETQMFGAVPVTFTLKGALEDKAAELSIIGTKMGHLSIPGFVQKKVVAKFTSGIDEGSIKDIRDATTTLVIENGDFHITVK